MRSFGIDIGGTRLKLARLDDGELAATDQAPTPSNAEELVELIESLAAAHGHAREPLGIAVPGWLDAERRRVLRADNVRGLEGLPLAERIEEALSAPVILDADTNAGAVGEARAGAGRGFERVLFVALGTGVGVALAVRGQPVRASHQTIGHAAAVPLGRAGLPAQERLGALGLARRGRAPLEELDRRATAGESNARALWLELGDDLAELLAFLVPFLRPEIVVLGGGVSQAASHFLPRASARLAARLGAPAPPLVRADRAPWSAAIGAALLAAERARPA